jgi:hypothetical protein
MNFTLDVYKAMGEARTPPSSIDNITISAAYRLNDTSSKLLALANYGYTKCNYN